MGWNDFILADLEFKWGMDAVPWIIDATYRLLLGTRLRYRIYRWLLGIHVAIYIQGVANLK
jgi:hypothetical protein